MEVQNTHVMAPVRLDAGNVVGDQQTPVLELESR